jgi:hypothetical protein
MRACLVGVVCLLGCSRLSAEPGDDLLVVPQVTPAAIRAGAELTVRIVVTNPGPTARNLIVNECPRPFVVKDRQGGWVAGPGGQTCTTELRITVLGSGASYEFVVPWTATVAPGTYAVEGWIREEGRSAQPRSPAVEFQVTP